MQTQKSLFNSFSHGIPIGATLKGFATRCKCLNPFQPFMSSDTRFEDYRFFVWIEWEGTQSCSHIKIYFSFQWCVGPHCTDPFKVDKSTIPFSSHQTLFSHNHRFLRSFHEPKSYHNFHCQAKKDSPEVQRTKNRRISLTLHIREDPIRVDD